MQPFVNFKNLKSIRYSTFETSASKAREKLSQKVLCVETGEVFESMTIASKTLNIPLQYISKSARFDIQIKGYTFKKIINH